MMIETVKNEGRYNRHDDLDAFGFVFSLEFWDFILVVLGNILRADDALFSAVDFTVLVLGEGTGTN
jgi:hypothetical protein